VSLLVAGGLTNGAVARRLCISPQTVNTHLRHMFAKLGIPDRVALAAVGASLDQVMSSPPAASTIDRVQSDGPAARLTASGRHGRARQIRRWPRF
jgi:hypothetical protein